MFDRNKVVAALALLGLLIGSCQNAVLAAAAEEPGECQSSLLIPTVTLHNGVEMPVLAVGGAHLITRAGNLPEIQRFTGFVPERMYRALNLAFESGIRAIDTAFVYRSHTQIRQVLGEWFGSGRLQRKDVFIGTKLFHGTSGVATASTHIPNLDDMTVEQVREAVRNQFEQILVELGVGYLDLLMLHWPAKMDSKHPLNPARRLAAWQVLEEYYDRGWIRAIGVSNFSEHHLEQLMKDGARIKPMVNQIEASVYIQFEDIVQYCKENGIVVQAYSPFARGLLSITDDSVVLEIAKKHKKDPGQIAIRYLVQKGYTVTFLSTSEKRLQSNQQIFDFSLDEEDMQKLNALNRPDGSWGLPSPYDMS